MPAANVALRHWCLTTAGQRVHGTTKAAPLTQFETVARAPLQPLPATPYELAVWKVDTVARDGYVTFDNAYYSVPCDQVGQTVNVRGGRHTVHLYD